MTRIENPESDQDKPTLMNDALTSVSSGLARLHMEETIDKYRKAEGGWIYFAGKPLIFIKPEKEDSSE